MLGLACLLLDVLFNEILVEVEGPMLIFGGITPVHIFWVSIGRIALRGAR